MKAILLCAGYATRLHPLTKDKPKHLLEVGGKPILEHILERVGEVGEVDEVFLVSNAKFFFHFLEWAKKYGEKYPSAKKISVINDGTESNETRLGALGDILFVIHQKRLREDILLIAADNLFDFSLTGMHQFYLEQKKTVIALYDIKDLKLASHYGVVEIDKSLRLTHFVEKPNHPQSTLISTGIYLLPKQGITLLELYVKYGYSTDKIGSFFEWLHKKEDVYCYITEQPWYDIGTKEQLEEANRHYADKGLVNDAGKEKQVRQ